MAHYRSLGDRVNLFIQRRLSGGSRELDNLLFSRLTYAVRNRVRRRFWSSACCATLLAATTLVATPRFIIDDDDYSDKITMAAGRLKQAGELVPADVLRHQVCSKGYALKSALPSRHKLEAPDLYDRLLESTLAVGSYYKCPDCGQWHFTSSAGFVVGADGLISTCCHVVLGEDNGVKESYLVAADAAGHVFPVRSVVAADPDADTCLLKIAATGLRPLPLRPGVRAGERVYCLSHPGGYYFMFTQGLVARLNRKSNEMLDEHGHTNGMLSRPILFLNVTAEFAPGSSGAPIVDESGNVVAQVASISDAGEPLLDDTNAPSSPSVPVRFCTATEEILHLADANLAETPEPRRPEVKPNPSTEVRQSAWETHSRGWVELQPEPDLKGWTRVPIPPTNHLGRAQWHVDTARHVLICDGDGGHEMLRLDRELRDGIFHVEFRFVPVPGAEPKYNSGVFLRNSADGTVWHQAQLTMDGGYWFGNSPVSGQLKRFKLPPTERRMKPAGEWNTLETSARGETLQVWLNGAVTCTYPHCEVPKGYLALESEGYRIEFRNLKLKTSE
jgi:hypothetical protein